MIALVEDDPIPSDLRGSKAGVAGAVKVKIKIKIILFTNGPI